jgi:Zn-dependent peptidase ImmA (M78 family)
VEQEALTLPNTPKGWATHLTKLLDLTGGPGLLRYPVEVAPLAMHYTRQAFGDEHIARVEAASIKGFEGSLIPFPDETKRWGILYNPTSNQGRIRFTIAHEFGHFLLHRKGGIRTSFECSMRDVAGGGTSVRQQEREADEFAAWLLMPLHDLRTQIHPRDRPTVDALSAAANRYGTSLLATALRWVCYTELRAIVVVSRDGFIDWAASSETARKTGAFIAAKRVVTEVPSGSAALLDDDLGQARHGIRHGTDVWFGVASTEMAVRSEAYDLTLSIVLLEDAEPSWHEREQDGDAW